MIEKLLMAGMRVARFNFSHGSHEYHQVCGGGWFARTGRIDVLHNHDVWSTATGNAQQPAPSNAQHQNHVRCHAGHQGVAKGG